MSDIGLLYHLTRFRAPVVPTVRLFTLMFSRVIIVLLLLCSTVFADGISVIGNGGAGQVGQQEGVVLLGTTSGTGFAPPPFVGVGDVVAGATAWYSCFRGYNAAYSTGLNAGCNIIRASDSHTCDVLIGSNGVWANTANCGTGGDNGQSAASFCNATTCKVTKMYDQSGANACSGHCDIVQATSANQPGLLFSSCNGNGIAPCVAFTTTTMLFSSSGTISTAFNQPISLSSVMAFSNTSGVAVMIAAFTATTDDVELFNNGSDTLTAGTNLASNDSANVAVAVNANANATSSTIYTNGMLTSGPAGAHAPLSGSHIEINMDAFGNAGATMSFNEAGLWNNVGFTTTQEASLNQNQQNFYGPSNFGSNPISPVSVIATANSPALPGLAQLTDTRLLSCWAASNPGQNSEIDGVLSNNSGTSWGTQAAIALAPATTEYSGCDLSLDASGHVLLLIDHENSGATSATSFLFVGTVGGTVGDTNMADISWDAGTNVTSNVTGGWVNSSFATPSPVLVLANGTWLAFIYDNVGDAGVVHCTSCNPTSQSWSAQTVIAAAGAGGCGSYSEMEAHQLSGGNIFAILRCDATALGYYTSVSTDNGATWSTPTRVITISAGSAGKPAFVMNPNNGHLVLVARAPYSGSNTTTFYWDYNGSTWTSGTEIGGGLGYCYASGVALGSLASFALCQGSFNSSDVIDFIQLPMP